MIEKIVVGIPYEDPSDLVAGTHSPQFAPIQIFPVSNGENPHDVLERHVTPPQHVWRHAGTLSPRAEAYYVERLGKDVPPELPESELTTGEARILEQLKSELQFAISMDAQREFDPPPSLFYR